LRCTCSRFTGLILQLSHHFRSSSGIPVQFTKTLFSGFSTPLLQIQKRQIHSSIFMFCVDCQSLIQISCSLCFATLQQA
jgi:hypothetical protein